MEERKDIEIKDYTTMGIGGKVATMLHIRTNEDIVAAVELAHKEGKQLFVLGEGSNTIFADKDHDVVVAKMEIPGFEVVSDAKDFSIITVGAGENWDSVVSRSVELGLSGIEAMSAIPGTTGATPFQNVGAYGQEIKDTLVSLAAYDTKTNEFVILENANCQFGYRDSIFRSTEKDRYIISSITLKLLKKAPAIPNYPGVLKYFSETGIEKPTLEEIRNAIIEIRSTKLPDPKKIKNNGSFFKNPIVEAGVAEGLKKSYPEATIFPLSAEKSKISAGWLIENAGLKGKDFGEMKVYEHNALVLVNKGSASFADLEAARDTVISSVQNKFGITLEPEPIIIK